MSSRSEELPSGTVSFVFTDIEGSTMLVRRLGGQYGDVLDRHRTILRSAWHQHEGHEIGTEGDSFFVAFGSGDAALAACVSAQRALASEPWPAGGEVLVRMGLHIGLAYPRRHDYISLAVHQATRIMSVAHGGQVIVSEHLARRVTPPADVDLVRLGRFRVRDFDEPLDLFEARIAGLQPVTRAPRAIPADGHNLIKPATELLGRDDDLEELRPIVKPGRLVTIVGPGGVGKTRLLVEFGMRVAGDWPDGVWMARLEALESPELIPGAIADAVGPAQVPGVELWEEVLDHLRDRRALVLLDNCEHLLKASASYASRLLDHCPLVGVVATSREPMGLRREWVVRVSPLDVREKAEASAAVELFRQRAERGGRVAGGALATRVVADLCDRLDGLPFAIELAAARAHVLSPEEIVRALDERAGILQSTDPDVPGRQRSLEDMLDWSYELLTDDEQLVLRRLAVFASSFSLVTAQKACAAGTDFDVAEVVWSLTTKSLVDTVTREGYTRYRLLRTVRDHIGRRLVDDEEAVVASRLAEHYALQVGPDRQMDRDWMGEVGIELDNIRAMANPSSALDDPIRQRLAWTVGRYHDVTDAFATGIEEVGRYVDVLPTMSTDLVALLTLLADLHLRVGDVDRARAALARAKTTRAQVGSPEWDDGGVIRTEGEVALREDDLDRARRLASEALHGDLSVRGRARIWNLLGLTLVGLGELDSAFKAFEQELKGWTELGLETFSATTSGNLAEVSLRLGRHRDAARHQLECLELAGALGQPVLAAFSMIMAAHLAARDERWALAIELHTAADGVLEESSYIMYESDRDAREKLLESATDHLGQPALGNAIERGSTLLIEEAVSATSAVLRAMS